MVTTVEVHRTMEDEEAKSDTTKSTRKTRRGESKTPTKRSAEKNNPAINDIDEIEVLTGENGANEELDESQNGKPEVIEKDRQKLSKKTGRKKFSKSDFRELRNTLLKFAKMMEEESDESTGSNESDEEERVEENQLEENQLALLRQQQEEEIAKLNALRAEREEEERRKAERRRNKVAGGSEAAVETEERTAEQLVEERERSEREDRLMAQKLQEEEDRKRAQEEDQKRAQEEERKRAEEKARRAEEQNRKPNRDEEVKLTYIGCKLDDKMSFNIWRGRITHHLASKGCGWTIGQGEEPTSESHRVAVRNLAADFVIRHVDDVMYRTIPPEVLMKHDPLATIEALQKAIEPSGKVRMFGLRERLSKLRFDWKHDNVTKFQAKFGELAEELRRCGEVDEKELRIGLIQSVKEAFPTVYAREISCSESLKLEDIFSLMRAEEMSREDDRRRENESKRPESRKNEKDTAMSARDKTRCYRCGEEDHWSKECTKKGIQCYNCNKLTDHIAADCDQPRRRPSAERSSRRDDRYRNRDRDWSNISPDMLHRIS